MKCGTECVMLYVDCDCHYGSLTDPLSRAYCQKKSVYILHDIDDYLFKANRISLAKLGPGQVLHKMFGKLQIQGILCSKNKTKNVNLGENLGYFKPI